MFKILSRKTFFKRKFMKNNLFKMESNTENINDNNNNENTQIEQKKTKVEYPKRKFALIHGYFGHEYCGNQK